MLMPLTSIPVPQTQPDELYQLEVRGQSFSFRGLKALLGAADHSKAGDRNAHLSADGDLEREAARKILGRLTLQHLHDRPLTTSSGVVDSVMRVNYAIDVQRFAELAPMSLGQLKGHLLEAPAEKLQGIGGALTGVMVAALAKLMDVHELILVSSKLHHPARARTTLGLPGTLSSRLQPNHPVDDLDGISMLTYLGLSMGSGDALLGVNPGMDTVDNVSAVLHHLDRLRRETGAPTQICVLAHIQTQLTCLRMGAPVEILFQSIAGTEATNVEEFGVSVELLDEAYEIMKSRGPLREAKQFMYFETGQGSSLSYGKHEGMDMTTAEALAYGLARRYDPFMVNNVTGFIGPETHADDREMILSNLQDLFMGKLMGLNMGMAPCYTLHSGISLEGQQIAIQLLTSGGAAYYMDVYQNTDRMLAYFDTSGHDDQTMRDLHGRRTTPEFTAWAVERGIFEELPDGRLRRGPQWGRPQQFCSKEKLERLRSATPALFGEAHAGPRPADAASREARLSQAQARRAVHQELDCSQITAVVPCRQVSTMATNKAAYLNDASLGAALSPASAQSLKSEGADLQCILSDGLSASALEHNLPELYPSLQSHLPPGLSQGQPILAPYARVKLAEAVARATGARLTVILLGERPGAEASDSLSAYLAFRLLEPQDQRKAADFSGDAEIEFEWTVISNIHQGGLQPDRGGQVLADKIGQILEHRAAGKRLESMLAATPA